MRFLFKVKHPFWVRLLGRGVLKHHLRQAAAPRREPALNVHGKFCVHLVPDEKEQAKLCGLPVSLEDPNGWLCTTHQATVFAPRRVQ